MEKFIMAVVIVPVAWMLIFRTAHWRQKFFALMMAVMVLLLLTAVWFSSVSMVVASIIGVGMMCLVTRFTPKKMQMEILANLKTYYLAWLLATLVLSTYEIVFGVNAYQLRQEPMLLLNIACSFIIVYTMTEWTLQKKLPFEAWKFFIERLTGPGIVGALAILIIKNSSLFFVLTLSRHTSFVTLLFWLVTFTEVIFLIITVFYIYNSYRFSIVNYRHEILYQTYDLQVEHLQQLEKKSQALRKISHDIHNHHLVLQELLASSDVERAQLYLQEFERFSQENIRDEYEFTNHAILNALLNQKLKNSQDHQIDVVFEVRVDRTLPLSDFDLCVVLGNLLDNAIEATQQVEPTKRAIRFQASYVNDNLVFMLENTFLGELNVANEEIHTTKADTIWHGIGLKNVKQIIAKNAGEFVYQVNDDHFRVLVRIPC